MIMLGLFLLVAIVHNKELSEKEENKSVFTFLGLLALLLVLGGLNFIIPAQIFPRAGSGLLMFSLIGLTATYSVCKGQVKVISLVGIMAIISFIMLPR